MRILCHAPPLSSALPGILPVHERYQPGRAPFYRRKLLFRDDGDAITHDASLLDAGIIDSTGVLELVCFLETTFGIEVRDDEMLPENLDSIRAISHYVARKLESRKVQLVA